MAYSVGYIACFLLGCKGEESRLFFSYSVDTLIETQPVTCGTLQQFFVAIQCVFMSDIAFLPHVIYRTHICKHGGQSSNCLLFFLSLSCLSFIQTKHYSFEKEREMGG
jgi:hypothetical protein